MNQPLPIDPFFDDDDQRTVIAVPTLGARTARSGTSRYAEPRLQPTSAEMPSHDMGLNPLVAAAHGLLALAPQIRATPRVADPTALKESLSRGLRDFEAQARARGIAPERALAARYILCTVLDESAGSTPWGGSGQWARHNLLVAFHNENAGGDKVFELMATLAEQPALNRDLLELIYAALCLGFEGRYGAAAEGRAQLEAVRERLAGIIRPVRGDHSPSLAQHWRGQVRKRRALLSWLPLWVTAAVTSLALLGVYLAMSFSLEARSDPVAARIQALRSPSAPVAAAAARSAPRRLASLLSAEVRDGRLVVRDEPDRSVVTMHGDGMFAPGSATLASDRQDVLRRVAQSVLQLDADVLVAGHTDSQPIRTLRYPSNWQLSRERANAVRSMLLAAGLPPERVRAEGRAAGEPVVDNDSAQHRAMNRRIELIVTPRNGAVPAAPGAPR